MMIKLLSKTLCRYSDTPVRRYVVTSIPRYAVSLRRAVTSAHGQASTELVLLMPVFILIAGIALCVGYMCWQGIKVQQAANFAARIQGQERVGGGVTGTKINEDNGLVGISDKVPSAGQLATLKSDPNAIGGMQAQGTIPGLYGRYRTAVQQLFNGGERSKLFVPAPDLGINSDRVRVVRVLRPPKVLNYQMQPIMLTGEAYGGEDSRMYGLPRWGSTGSGNPYYQSQIKE